MEKKERRFPEDYVEEAIETTDHLLWEAIIRICGNARSKAFQKKGNEVRVVYEIEGKIVSGKLPAMPENFHNIKRVFTELSLQDAPIYKQRVSGIMALEKRCSEVDYFRFGLQILEGRIDKLRGKTSIELDDLANLLEWEMVEAVLSEKELRCPCNGSHLEWARGLIHHFNVVLYRPEKVGADTYEFRFSVIPV